MPNAKRARALIVSCALAITAVAFGAFGDAPGPGVGAARRTLDEYRHFRIVSIDLLGRAPTRAELAEFENSDFDFERWVDGRLRGGLYAERLTRI